MTLGQITRLIRRAHEKVLSFRDFVIPDIILRNRGYLMVMIPVIILWGAVASTILFLAESISLGQQIVNATTAISIGFGAFACIVQGWKDMSFEKLKVVLLWSFLSITAYFCAALICIGVSIFVGGAFRVGRTTQQFLTLVPGGFGTLYLWYRASWFLFRKIKRGPSVLPFT